MGTLSIWKKTYVLMIVFSFIVTFLTTFVIARNRYLHTLKDTIRDSKTTANLLSSLIREHQKAALGILESYAQRPLLIDAVSKKDVDNSARHLKPLNETYGEMGIPFITDKYGTLWANYPLDSRGFGTNLAYRDWYKGVSKNWKPYVSSMYQMVVLEKGLAVALSVPVFDRNGKVVGILGVAQRAACFGDLLKANIPNVQKEITVLDQEGNILFSNYFPYDGEITKYHVRAVMEKALAGGAADLEIADARDKRGTSYVSIVPVKNLGWSVIVGHERNSIMKDLSGYFFYSAATGSLIFIFTIISLGYFRRAYRYQKTKEMQKSEEKYKILFDETMDGICLANAETGIIVDCNRSLADLVCRERAELIGQSQTILHPSEAENEDFSPTFKQHLNDKMGEILEAQILTATGNIREVEIKANLITINNVKHLQGLFHDITDRKRMEETLRASEERLRNLFDNAMEGVYRSTLDGRLMAVNTAFARMFGYESPEEALGAVTDIANQMYANPDDRMKIVGIFKAMGHVKYFECQMRRKDGSIFWTAFNGRLNTDSGTNAPCLEGFIMDITERKQAEEAARKLNIDLEQQVSSRTAELEAAYKELEAFSYSVSHDLRTPLRSIDGFSQALLEDYRDTLDDTARSYLDRVRKATQYMGRLIDDMLKLSRVTRIEFQHVPVDLSTMVRVISEKLQANDPDITVDVVVRSGVLVNGDPSLLQIALENLVGNAWKFTSNEAKPRVEFGTAVREGKTACFIRDNGVGFDMAHVDKLFGAFQRLHTSSEFPGTGIGLATVQRIMNRHGGKVWAEAEVGKGATFYFTLPG